MNDSKELVLRIADAETQAVNALNDIMKEYNLPFFLFEPIIEKIYRQVVNGKTNEIQTARAREQERAEV